MKVNNPNKFPKHFNMLLEYCKSKYSMPKDKTERLKIHFKERYPGFEKMMKHHPELETDLIHSSEFSFDILEHPEKYEYLQP